VTVSDKNGQIWEFLSRILKWPICKILVKLWFLDGILETIIWNWSQIFIQKKEIFTFFWWTSRCEQVYDAKNKQSSGWICSNKNLILIRGRSQITSRKKTTFSTPPLVTNFTKKEKFYIWTVTNSPKGGGGP